MLQDGFLQSAKVIYNRADRIDVTAMGGFSQDSPKSGMELSILGSLLYHAKRHPYHILAVKTFLELVGARDSLFNNVMRQGPNNYTMNALQFTILYTMDAATISTGTELLAVLLQTFNHPRNHLACQDGPRRLSLLHLAVKHGNYAALDILLAEPGMNADMRNVKNLTALDLCLTRWQDSIRDGSDDYRLALKAGISEAAARAGWEATTEGLIECMERRGASRYGNIKTVFKRLSHFEMMWIRISGEGRIQRDGFDPTGIQSDVFSSAEKNDTARAIANLEVGGCLFFSR
ncbi:hypothetical protein DPSP01_013562 [Paraphaeosphaeria sporulosa]